MLLGPRTLALLPVLACGGACQLVNLELNKSLERLSKSYAPRTVAIAYLDSEGNRPVLVRGHEMLLAASSMKVPLMIDVFRLADAGELSLDDPIEVRNRFQSVVDDSPYELDRADDSDRKLYAKIGERLEVWELLRHMIAHSSNLATNLLLELTEPARIQRTMESLGTRRMRVLRGIEDSKAFDAGRNNTVNAFGLMALLAAIARGDAASPASCQQMIGILGDQECSDMIPAGLPPGTYVAHDTGHSARVHHDAAIVYPKDSSPPYVLVVLTEGFDDPKESGKVIAEVAAIVHQDRISR